MGRFKAGDKIKVEGRNGKYDAIGIMNKLETDGYKTGYEYDKQDNLYIVILKDRMRE